MPAGLGSEVTGGGEMKGDPRVGEELRVLKHGSQGQWKGMEPFPSIEAQGGMHVSE